MITPEEKRALRYILDQLSGQLISWAVTGSLSFALHGVDLAVHDIDLQTNREGVYQIQALLSNYVIKPVAFSSTGRIQSHLGRLEIEGVKVEIMGDFQKRLEDGSWEPPVNVEDHKVIVIWEGREVPVLSLEYEIQAYRALGREEKARFVEQWLQKKSLQGGPPGPVKKEERP